MIAEELAAAIARGEWLLNTKFSSIRESAERFQVSINTIKTAYQLLEERGLIIPAPSQGITCVPFHQHCPHKLLRQQIPARYH
jgi:DNA-binding transcriptional regulator YhcF (GntR family)